MPLLDHFHPPLFPTRHWESFHAIWCSEIAGHLNQAVLPARYFAETQVHIGGRVEVDVGTLEGVSVRPVVGNGSVTTLQAEVWAPPAAALVMPAEFPDEIEVQVLGGATGAHLVGAIEMVSPRNKDRPE